MKKLIILIALAVAFITQTKAQDGINIIFQNNADSKGTKSFELTIENPDGTKKIEKLSMSDQSKRKTLNIPIGAKIYVENSTILNTLGGGAAPDKKAPFMIVMKRDLNQCINLVAEKNADEAVVLANAQKSADKLKLDADCKKTISVTGNIATVTYTNNKDKTVAVFDCDKKNGNVKNIEDLSKKSSKDEAPKEEEKATETGSKKLKGALGKIK